MSLPPKDAKNEQKPEANSSGSAHLVIGDGLLHIYKKLLPLDSNTRLLNNEMTGLPKDKPESSLIFLIYVVCEFIPKDAKNEQKPGANSSGGAHLVIGDGLRHFLLCSIIASDSIAYIHHLVQGRRNIWGRLGCMIKV